MAKIVAQNVKFSYGEEVVLKDINMEIEEGEFVCFLGASGCGKSTFLRLLSGLLNPQEGQILIDGIQIKGATLERGIVFQDYSLFPWFTTGKNILLSLQQKYKNMPKEQLIDRAKYYLNEVGLPEHTYYKYPFQLSGGMQQRSAICKVFAIDPPILLMDEPFGALDAITRAKLQQLLSKLWKKEETRRKTVVFVTHDVDEALLLADKILVFGSSPGKIIYTHQFEKVAKEGRETFLRKKETKEIRDMLLDILNKDIEKGLD